MRHRIFFYSLLFLLSCNSTPKRFSNSPEKSSPKSNSEMQNIKYLGVESDGKKFELYSQKAVITYNQNVLSLSKIDFYLIKNNKIIYTIKANTGKYYKDKELIILNKNSIYDKKNNLNLNLENLTYKIKDDILISNKANIIYIKNNIKSKNLKITNFEIIKLKGVKAHLLY